jgi:predicted dehydrogenase
LDTIRLGLVGAGAVAERHLAAAAEVAEVRVAAVADVHADRSERLAAAAGARAYTGFAALLDDPDVDVVVLTVPHAVHAEYAVRAAAAGRHVLVEKPMAVTVADCDRMVAAADAAGVLLWVGQQQRQFTHVRVARDVLRAGDLGEPLLYVERRSTDYPPGRPSWFVDPDAAGGGVAMLVGPHTVDRASWLLGTSPVAVAGTVATPDGWRVETDASGLVWFDGAPPSQFALHTDPVFYHETTVVCERGRLLLDAGGLTTVGPDGTARRLVQFDGDREYTASFARQYRALARAVDGQAAPDVLPAEGRQVVATIRALYQSARLGGARVEITT